MRAKYNRQILPDGPGVVFWVLWGLAAVISLSFALSVIGGAGFLVYKLFFDPQFIGQMIGEIVNGFDKATGR